MEFYGQKSCFCPSVYVVLAALLYSCKDFYAGTTLTSTQLRLNENIAHDLIFSDKTFSSLITFFHPSIPFLNYFSF